MKSYTDVEQSKKLADILPLESADMCYPLPCDETDKPSFDNGGFGSIPCWSLAALIEALPNEISTGENSVDKYQIDIRKYDGESNTTWYQIAYGNDRGSSGEWHDMINTGEKENIIDCCYQMIVRLKEKNLL